MLLRTETLNILIIYFVVKVSSLALSTDQTAEAIACSRNPDLPYCKAFGARTVARDRREDREKDVVACKELRTEYIASCTRDKISTKNNEFCNAYENVCFSIPSGEPDQPIKPKNSEVRESRRVVEAPEEPTTTVEPKSQRKDYTEFCKEYKQRFLYVCPDPFRFGQRAAVFCPIYSERCNLPVPEKPVPPTQKPPVNPLGEALSNRSRVCAQYRGFAIAYCNNPFALQRPDVREGCSCKTLVEEFRAICFSIPPKGAEAETKAFCDTFRDSCRNTVANIKTPEVLHIGKYCEHHRERFRYVCPDPTRFGKYTAVAIDFCPRYQSFCPNEELPTKPEEFEEKHSKHIYIREHQYYCDLYDDWAKVYCFNPVILKVPRYQFQCLIYKTHCIDPLTQVVYAVGKK